MALRLSIVPLLWAASLGAGLPGAATKADCTAIALRADYGRCDAAGCTLSGNARLHCGSRFVRADELRVAFAEDRSFAGCDARGAVSYVDGDQLLQAQTLHVDGDQVRGEVRAAQLVQFAETPADWSALLGARAPMPRRTLRVSGAAVQRRAGGAWRAHDARLTLCDCGAAPPSWALSAARVDVDAGGTRATAFWPVLRLHLWPGRTVPVTPPLPPISVPLRRRAFGLLPPRLQFLAPRAPSVDVPVFFPLGPSWDVTASLGVRPDWGGAPRLGARLRGQPRRDAEVNSDVMLTFDHRPALRRLDAGAPAAWANDPAWRRARSDLAARVLWLHHHELWPGGAPQPRPHLALSAWAHPRLHAELALASDNEVPRAFAVAPAERAAAYLPSRLWLQAASPRHIVALQGTYLQRLEATGRLADGSLAPFAAGLRASGAGTVQRPLALQWQLLALGLGDNVTVDAGASWALLLPVAPGAQGPPGLLAPEGALATPVHLLGTTLGAAWRRPLGAVRLEARGGLDVVAGFTADSSGADGGAAGVAASPVGRLRASLALARAYRGGVHVLEPRLDVLGVALRTTRRGPLGGAGPVGRAGATVAVYDERLLRQPVLQGALVLHQAFVPRGRAGAAMPWRLNAVVPFDLRRGRPLRPALDGQLTVGGGSSASFYVGVAPAALRRRGVAAALQDVALDATQRLGATTFNVGYVRLAPTAERLQRTAYTLAAPDVPTLGAAGDGGGEALQHTLHVGVGHAAEVGLGARYQASVQLPRPNAATGGFEPACSLRGGGRGPRACLTAHSAALSYSSPCHCWRADAVLSAAPQDFWGTFRFVVTLDVAGYRLGTPG